MRLIYSKMQLDKLTAVLLIAFCSFSFARSNEYFSLSIEELLNVNITGATLMPTSLKDVPAVVKVYEKQQIELLGFSELNQLLSYVSGFQVKRNDSGSNTYNVSSRGVQSNTSSREILVMIDGQRLNSDWSGGIGALFAQFPLSHVKRVEVIKGPGSAIYGSNAFSGIINIITEMDDEISARWGSNNNTLIQGQFNLDAADISISGFVSKQEYDGTSYQLFDPFSPDFVSAKDPFSTDYEYLKLNWKNWQLTYNKHQNKGSDFYVEGFVSGNKNTTSVTNKFVNLQYSDELNEEWNLTTKVFYSNRDFELGGKIVPAPTETFISGQIEEQDFGIETVFYHTDKITGDVLVIGAEYRQPKLTNTDAYTSGFVELYLPQAPTTSRNIGGLFVQYQQQLTDEVNYILGGRLDHYSNFGEHFSPRLGMNWQATNQQMIKLIYSESFRAPTRSETDVINSSAIVANPNLEPEVFKNIDLLWQYEQDNFLFSANLFTNRIEEAITPLSSSPSSYSNTGEGSSTGIELEWQKTFDKQWFFTTSTMWLIDHDSEIYRDSDNTANMTLSHKGKTYSYSFLVNYSSARLDINQSVEGYTKIPARTLVDFNMLLDINDNLTLSGAIKNLFDKKYFG
ncbi:MAG: TonB-dependent receptor, partial [Gammaproteobacteria bacterium]|nr:TonB-dependent receptor [Gammaproteobacteria bacterium]